VKSTNLSEIFDFSLKKVTEFRQKVKADESCQYSQCILCNSLEGYRLPLFDPIFGAKNQDFSLISFLSLIWSPYEFYEVNKTANQFVTASKTSKTL